MLNALLQQLPLEEQSLLRSVQAALLPLAHAEKMELRLLQGSCHSMH